MKMMNNPIGWFSGWGGCTRSGLGRWSFDSDMVWCDCVGVVTLMETQLWWVVDGGGRRTVMAVLDQCRGWSAGGCDLFVWIGPWAWAIPLCHYWLFIYFQVLFYLWFSVGFLLLISPYQFRVGLGGLCPVLCT